MVIERFVVRAPHDGQPSVCGGTVLETLSNGQVVESALTVIPVNELSQWVPSLNAQALVENQSLQGQVVALTTERNSLQSELTQLQADYDAKVNDNESKHFQIQTLTEQVATLTTDLAEANSAKDAAVAAKDAAEAQVATLQAMVAELEAQVNPAPPVQQIATNFQIRAWLITHYGTQIIDQVKSLISAIPDPVEKLLAEQQWEYANNVFRNNPFVERIGTALGLTTEQLDVAYAEACQIQ